MAAILDLEFGNKWLCNGGKDNISDKKEDASLVTIPVDKEEMLYNIFEVRVAIWSWIC